MREPRPSCEDNAFDLLFEMTFLSEINPIHCVRQVEFVVDEGVCDAIGTFIG